MKQTTLTRGKGSELGAKPSVGMELTLYTEPTLHPFGCAWWMRGEDRQEILSMTRAIYKRHQNALSWDHMGFSLLQG